MFFVFYFISFWLNAHATIKQSFWHIITTLLQNVCGTYNNLNYENVTAENKRYTYHAGETKEFLYLCSYSQNMAKEYGYFKDKTYLDVFNKNAMYDILLSQLQGLVVRVAQHIWKIFWNKCYERYNRVAFMRTFIIENTDIIKKWQLRKFL